MLVSYLYDETAADERVRFKQHLEECALCRTELESLANLRTQMAQWTPPESGAGPAAGVRPAIHRQHSFTAVLRELPVWARVAAATLVVGVSAGAANLRVTSTPEGLSIRTGWVRGSDQTAARSSSQPAAPSRADLADLEERLRAEIRDQTASVRESTLQAVSQRPHDDDAARGVRALIQESERRQQRELALRLAEVSRDMQVQRQADLVKIDRSLGIIQNRTGLEVMRQQQLLNNLIRVSQRQ